MKTNGKGDFQICISVPLKISQNLQEAKVKCPINVIIYSSEKRKVLFVSLLLCYYLGLICFKCALLSDLIKLVNILRNYLENEQKRF